MSVIINFASIAEKKRAFHVFEQFTTEKLKVMLETIKAHETNNSVISVIEAIIKKRQVS